MCGIIAGINLDGKQNLPKLVEEQFNKQALRGRRGFGYVAVFDNEVIHAKSTTEEKIIASLRTLDNPKAILFHHRIPTSSSNSVPSNHPILVKNKKVLENRYFLIHNGHISNYSTLEDEHNKEGFNYSTKNEFTYAYGQDKGLYYDVTDSEALGVELAKFIEGKTKYVNCWGALAFIMLQIDKDNKPVAVYYGRNVSNPLKFYQDGKLFFLASEAKGLSIPSHKLFRYDLNTLQYSVKDFTTEKITVPVSFQHEQRGDDYGFNTSMCYNNGDAGDIEFPISENFYWVDFAEYYSHLQENRDERNSSIIELIEERDILIQDIEDLRQDFLTNYDLSDSATWDWGEQIANQAKQKMEDALELTKQIKEETKDIILK